MGASQREFRKAALQKFKEREKLLKAKLDEAMAEREKSITSQESIYAKNRALRAKKLDFKKSQARITRKEKADNLLNDQNIYDSLKAGQISMDDAYMAMSSKGRDALSKLFKGRKASLSSSNILGINKALMSGFANASMINPTLSFDEYRKENLPRLTAGLDVADGSNIFKKRFRRVNPGIENDYDNAELKNVMASKQPLVGGGFGYTNKRNPSWSGNIDKTPSLTDIYKTFSDAWKTDQKTITPGGNFSRRGTQKPVPASNRPNSGSRYTTPRGGLYPESLSLGNADVGRPGPVVDFKGTRNVLTHYINPALEALDATVKAPERLLKRGVKAYVGAQTKARKKAISQWNPGYSGN